MPTRRHLLRTAATLTALHPLRTLAQTKTPDTARPDVAAIDHDRILAAANHALTLPLTPNLTTGAIPALAAAHLLSPDNARYRTAALAHLHTITTLNNELTETNHPEDILGLAPLAEIAQSIPFLTPDPTDLNPLKTWFAALLTSLNTSRTGGLARDHKDHLAGVWLLVATAAARLTANDNALAALRHQFKTSTVRAQIRADGVFPHELITRDPYRNSLFALDLLTGAAVLLSTRFESLWDFELQDGPGLRAAVAKYAPWIEDRATWPYPADATLFHDLPCRRPALLFAARAYSHPEYATIWLNTTPAEPAAPALLATFPIRQPILWVTRPTP